MRYEAKHNYLKKLSQKLGNFINLSWTLATRHQQWSCYQWMDREQIGSETLEVGPCMFPCMLKFIIYYSSYILFFYVATEQCGQELPDELRGSTCIRNVKYVTMNGQTYKPSCAVVMAVDEKEGYPGDPVFGKVKAIYIVDGKPVLFVSVFVTQEYSNHFHAYIVKTTARYNTILVDSLLSSFPYMSARFNVFQSYVHSLLLNITYFQLFDIMSYVFIDIVKIRACVCM